MNSETKQTTIGSRLSLMALLTVLILAAIGAVMGFGEVRISDERNRGDRIADYTNRAHIKLLEARRREKDFLLRREPKYVESNQQAVADLIKYTESLAGIVKQEDLKAVEQLKEMALDYKEHFLRIASTQSALGYDEEAGLQGRLRDAVHGIENKLKAYRAPRLVVSMLTMRRREKDFILRIDAKYAQELEEEASTFRNLIASNNEVLPGERQVIESLFATYVGAFKDYYAAALLLEEHKQTTSDAAHKLEPIMAALVKGAEHHRQAATADLRVIWFIIGLLLVLGALLIVGVIVIQSRRIRRDLNGIVAELESTSQQVNSASQQVAGSGQSLADSTSTQAASLEETASTMQEIRTTVEANAEQARQAGATARKAMDHTKRGTEAMGRMSGAIQEIRSAADQTARIIKTIDEIAFQTNLLALNAAVEAARAGDAGRGFAVVAEEVRNLALRSAEAARNTSDLIEASVTKSELGVQTAREVGAVLGELHQAIEDLDGLVQSVVDAVQEQSRRIEQVNRTVEHIDGITQSNAANAEQSAAAGEELSAQALEMGRIITRLSAVVGRSANVGGKAGAGSGRRGVHGEPHLGVAIGRAKLVIAGAAEQRSQSVPGGLRARIEADRQAVPGFPAQDLGTLGDADFRDQ